MEDGAGRGAVVRRFVSIALLLAAGAAWAQPSTVYAKNAPARPSSQQTDFTWIVDLSDLPQAWWDAVDSSDAGRGRVYLDSGPTQISFDSIAFDDTAETGFWRIGPVTVSAVADTFVRIYPPNTGNTSAATGDPYDANWEGYWPMEDDPGGTAPQIIDRTANSRDLTTEGTMTSGDLTTGQIGNGLECDGIDDILSVTGQSINLGSNFLVMAWANYANTGNGARHLFDLRGAGSEVLAARAANNDCFFRDSGGTTPTGGQPSLTVTASAWKHYIGRGDGTNAISYVNATQEASQAWGNSLTDISSIRIAGSSSSTNEFGGIVDDVQIHSTARSADWISYEYSQTDDNATFWGAWTMEGGGASIAPHVMYYKRMREAA